MLDQDWTELESRVLDILQAQPAGLSEYEFIRRLADGGYTAFKGRLSGDSVRLFRVHFTLFHVLYRLRERLSDERRGDLHISPLRIVLHACPQDTTHSRHLSDHDPLRDYYMDTKHLDNTSAEDVDSLLQGFWSKLAGGGTQREQALQVLGLDDPVDDETIKHRYRRLVMRLHPDRGGNDQRLSEVNAAMAVLIQRRKRA